MKTKLGLIVMCCVLAGSALAGPGQGIGPYPHVVAPPIGSFAWVMQLAFH